MSLKSAFRYTNAEAIKGRYTLYLYYMAILLVMTFIIGSMIYKGLGGDAESIRVLVVHALVITFLICFLVTAVTWVVLFITALKNNLKEIKNVCGQTAFGIKRSESFAPITCNKEKGHTEMHTSYEHKIVW